MAGIVLGLGKVAGHNFNDIQRNYESLKGLKVSYEFCSNECLIVKYKREGSEADNNYFDSTEVAICVVGTLLYKKYSLVDSVKKLGQDLQGGKNFSNLIEYIDGHFFLVVILKKCSRVILMTDAGGVINIYLIKKGGNYFFSSSMLALAQCFEVSVNSSAILGFIRTGMFLDDTTYFNEIEALKPASLYEYDLDTAQLQRKQYWSVPKKVDECITFKEAATNIANSLRQIIDVLPTKEVLYDFTGGYDSRFLLSFSYGKEKDSSDINTFFFGPPNSREAKIVKKNCVNLGIKHDNYVVQDDWPQRFYDYILESNNLCDGLENACAYAPILMTQRLKRKHFRYAVHGQFGELYRPRTWEFEFGRRGKKRPANLMRMIKYRNLADDFDGSIFSGAYMEIINEVPNMLLSIYKKTNSIFDQKTPNTLQLDYVYYAQRARRWGGRNITTANQIIQPICPLWFRRPLEISLSLPPEYKKRSKLMRYIVENESPKFAKEKMITGTPFVLMNLKNIFLFIPGLLFFLRKVVRKFSQIFFNKTIWAGLTIPDYNTGDWYRTALQDPRCQDLLDWDRMVSREFYDQRSFESFIEGAKCHDFHFYGQLGNIITVELTLRAVKLATEVGD